MQLLVIINSVLQAPEPKKPVDPMSAAMGKVQDFFFGPEQTMEELSAGAEDGLSRWVSM